MITMDVRKKRAVATRRVLVVDDHVDAANSLAMLLRLRGHQVDQAYNSDDALRIAKEQRPDVILLDIGLPRMTGYKVAEHLRSLPQTRDAIIIAVTGHGLPADRQRSQQVGIDLHWVKPVDPDRLLELLDEDLSQLRQ